MTNFTAGPWDFDHGDEGTVYSAPYCTVTALDGDLTIAEVNDRYNLEEGHANGYLIKSAPRLFQACVNAESALVSLIGKHGDGGAGLVVKELQDAIAEAKGNQK